MSSKQHRKGPSLQNRLWSFIKSKGSSCAHFRLCHKGYELAFHGLTEDEYLQQSEA
jgi:hypothetical protein